MISRAAPAAAVSPGQPCCATVSSQNPSSHATVTATTPPSSVSNDAGLGRRRSKTTAGRIRAQSQTSRHQPPGSKK